MSKDTIVLIIWVAVIGVIFAVLWRKGHLTRLSTFVQETREELRKCTWPTWDELKGSTVVVVVSVLLLGGFTVVVDLFFNLLSQWLT
jgi:preprotein translocase subunit SecE